MYQNNNNLLVVTDGVTLTHRASLTALIHIRHLMLREPALLAAKSASHHPYCAANARENAVR